MKVLLSMVLALICFNHSLCYPTGEDHEPHHDHLQVMQGHHEHGNQDGEGMLSKLGAGAGSLAAKVSEKADKVKESFLSSYEEGKDNESSQVSESEIPSESDMTPEESSPQETSVPPESDTDTETRFKRSSGNEKDDKSTPASIHRNKRSACSFTKNETDTPTSSPESLNNRAKRSIDCEGDECVTTSVYSTLGNRAKRSTDECTEDEKKKCQESSLTECGCSSG